MTECTIDLLTNTGLWMLALALYYKAGKSIGYNAGYVDGIKQGQKNVIEFMDNYQSWGK